MMRALTLLALVGCGGASDTDPIDGEACPVSGAALPDLFGELAGIDHACEDAPEYRPDVSTATSYWIGEFEIDDCDNVTGTETWVLFANPEWIENGGYDCQIVWSVSGTRHEPTQKGDYGLTLTATVDELRSDCPEDASSTPIYVGDTEMALAYDVAVSGDTSVVTFAGSGNLVGEGHANGGRVSYLSDLFCLLF